MTLIDWWSLLGPLGMIMALVALALISRRLGHVTRMRPYYLGGFIAAGLMLASLITRIALMLPGAAVFIHAHPALAFAYVGLPAVAMTLGVFVAWRYWSWLLAERS